MHVAKLSIAWYGKVYFLSFHHMLSEHFLCVRCKVSFWAGIQSSSMEFIDNWLDAQTYKYPRLNKLQDTRETQTGNSEASEGNSLFLWCQRSGEGMCRWWHSTQTWETETGVQDIWGEGLGRANHHFRIISRHLLHQLHPSSWLLPGNCSDIKNRAPWKEAHKLRQNKHYSTDSMFSKLRWTNA